MKPLEEQRIERLYKLVGELEEREKQSPTEANKDYSATLRWALFELENTLALTESNTIATGVERKRYNSFKELLEEIENEEEQTQSVYESIVKGLSEAITYEKNENTART